MSRFPNSSSKVKLPSCSLARHDSLRNELQQGQLECGSQALTATLRVDPSMSGLPITETQKSPATHQSQESDLSAYSVDAALVRRLQRSTLFCLQKNRCSDSVEGMGRLRQTGLFSASSNRDGNVAWRPFAKKIGRARTVRDTRAKPREMQQEWHGADQRYVCVCAGQ